jgi:hypothetical protein
MSRTEEELADLFWEKCVLNHATGCWEWTGTRSPKGYGVMTWITNGRRLYGAHRVAYALFRGDIGDLHVMHACDNPSCCNPNHLSIGTHADNTADKVNKGRQVKGEDSGRSKLTEIEVQQIRLRVKSQTQRYVAEAYGVARSVISKINTREVWAHLPDRDWTPEEIPSVLAYRWVDPFDAELT